MSVPSDKEVSPAAAKVDGRTAGRERNLLAVVDALLDLYAEGELRPAADAVAKRAGISRRSVFRYFDDLDDLNRTAFARQLERVWPLVELPGMGEGSLEARIATIAAQRATLYAAIAPVARVTRLRAPYHKVIGEELALNRKGLSRQVQRHFQAELTTLPASESSSLFAAVDALLSFETYDFLVATRGSDSEEVRAMLVFGLNRLFAAPIDSQS